MQHLLNSRFLNINGIQLLSLLASLVKASNTSDYQTTSTPWVTDLRASYLKLRSSTSHFSVSYKSTIGSVSSLSTHLDYYSASSLGSSSNSFYTWIALILMLLDFNLIYKLYSIFRLVMLNHSFYPLL